MWYPLYHIRFVDDTQGAWLVEIQGEESNSPVVEIEGGDSPLTWMGDGNASMTQVILGATGTLDVNINEDTMPHLTMGKLLPDGALSRRVVVTRDGVTVWTGFVQPQTFNQAWEAPPFNIGLSLMDTIAALKYVYIEQGETAGNILDMLFSAYQKVGGEKTRREFLRTNVKAYNGRDDIYTGHPDWGTGKVFPEFWTSDPDKKVSYADVLSILLSPHARLMQTGSTWFAGRDDITTTRLYRPADTGGGNLAPNETGAPTTDISHTISGSNNTQAQLPPPSKVTSNYIPDEGTINVSGDNIFRLSSDMIVSDGVSSLTDVLRADGTTLRYLFLTDIKGNFRRTTKIHHYTMDWSNTVVTNDWRTDGNMAPGWAQVLQREAVVFDTPSFTMDKELVFCGRRERENTGSTSFHNTWSEDYIEIQTPVYVQPGTNMLQIKAEAFGMDLTTPDGAAMAVFFGDRPGQLSQYLGGWASEWNDYSPGNIFQPFYFVASGLRDGINFHLPGGKTTGYITLMITPGVTNESETFGDSFVVSYTDITLSYVPENIDPRKPMQWNKDAVNNRKVSLAGGVDDITMNFQTLAGVTPDASTFFSPRRGFDDSIHFVRTPREMIDIEAVQVTAPEGVPGITSFSLFLFGGKTYFPAAIGMNARENTVRLKLIRTLS